VVVIAALGVGVFMVTKIIPKFADFLLAQGRALPGSTQTLIDISDFVRDNGLSIIAVLIAIIVVTLIAYQTRVGRVQIDSFVLRIPVIGSALVTGAMSQMSWALSILLKSGVTVFDALKISSRLMGNKVYANKLEQASAKIMGGAEMSASIQHPQIPVLVTQMIAVGENTGTLDSVLQELGEYYEKLLEISIKRLSAMIEPAMVLVIGGMVGFVYYAFFQALFSLVAGG
jgi:type IV pilus assembly protein PilC